MRQSSFLCLSGSFGVFPRSFPPAPAMAMPSRVRIRMGSAPNSYQTLKSFGQIVKSLFILCYADGLALRRAIGRRLNEVELAGRFTRAEREERETEACNRLIGNRIIRWNCLYFASQIEKAGDEEAGAGLWRAIAAHSPMSRAHVNMLGEYDFSGKKLKDYIGILPLKPAA